MQHGIGFQARTSFRDVFPMLMDMRHDFLLTWDKIHIVHDDSVDSVSAQDLVNGLTQEYVHGIPTPDVTLFRVNSFGYGTPVSDHTNCLTESGRSSVTFTSSHLMDHLVKDKEIKFFIVIAKTKTIENIIEEVGSYSNAVNNDVRILHLLLNPYPHHPYKNYTGTQQIPSESSQTLAVRVHGQDCEEEGVLEQHRPYSSTDRYGSRPADNLTLFPLRPIFRGLPVPIGHPELALIFESGHG